MTAVDFKTAQEIDPFDAAYRRVRAEYDAALKAADGFGGPCETCRYFRKEGGRLSDDYCMNPLAVSFAFDRAKGEIAVKGHLISSWSAMRKNPGVPDLCGPNRQLWKSRTALQAVKTHLARWWGLYLFIAAMALTVGLPLALVR